MSFFDIETGLSTLLQGVERRKDDRALLAAKLKSKLRELEACGLVVAFDEDDTEASVISATGMEPRASA